MMGALAMMIVAPIAALLIQMAISRTREYSADDASAKYTGTALQPGECIAEAGELVEADPHGRLAGHRPHVHHQAVHRAEHHAPVLDASLDR